MLAVLVAVISAASFEEVKIAAPGLTYVGISQQQGDVYLDYFAQQVIKRGVHVITRTDVAAVLGLERQKQLLGCNEESCVGELSGALGASALLVGSIATAGSGFVVNLKVMEAGGSTKTLAVYSERVPSEDRLYEYLEASARELAKSLAPPDVSGRLFAVGFSRIPITAGAVLSVGGGILFGIAKGIEGSVRSGDASIASLADARARLDTAVGLQTGGLVAGGVGLGSLLIGLGLWLFSGGPALAVVPQLALDRAGVALSWSLP